MFSRPSALHADPFAAVWAGEYDRAVAQLHNDRQPGATVMRARVYANLRLESRILADYAAGAGDALDPVESINYRAIVASAMHATSDHASARAVLAEAQRDASKLRDPLLNLTIAYYRGIGEYAAGEHDDAQAIFEETLVALEALPERARLPRESYRFEGNHLRARLLQNRSIGAYVRNDYAGEERALLDALMWAELVVRRDTVHESNILAALAKMFVRYPSHRARELVYVKARAMHFTAHIDHRRAAIKSGLAANRSIFGNSIDPETLGGRTAPMLPYRLSACIGTLLYGAWPDSTSYREAMDFAVTVARASDWSAPAEDEGNRLLTFAAIVAPHDVAIADELLRCFERAFATYSRYLVSYRDPRRATIERFARGCLAKARGDAPTATAAFAEVNIFWRERGLLVAAALGGLEAYPLTRDPADLSPARAFVATYPHTDFSNRLVAALDACRGTDVPLFPFLADGSLAAS
ncbi:MAG: hypothetical protein NVS4B5_05710 [Vulcanimicrobiaceae bacterium]